MAKVRQSRVLMSGVLIRNLPAAPTARLRVDNTADADVFVPADKRVDGAAIVYGDARTTYIKTHGHMRVRGAQGRSGGDYVLREDGALYLGRTPVLLGRRTQTQRGGLEPERGWVTWAGLVGSAPPTLEMFEALARAADSTAPVWLRGESGTGKELSARAVHTFSQRAEGPFVTLNCAALPESLIEAELFGVTKGAFTGAHQDRPGAFQRADGGTLFLDEIGELPLSLQAKLLRALETGEVTRVGGTRVEQTDIRIVTATWRDLEHEVFEGRFRHDLLHRLWVLRVELPPLRQRRTDIPQLILARLAERDALHLFPDPALLRRICASPWPGNIRQLYNQIERAIAYDDPAGLVPNSREPRPKTILPRRDATELKPHEHVQHLAHETIARHLHRHHGNRTQAARTLGISRSTLYRWLKSPGFSVC